MDCSKQYLEIQQYLQKIGNIENLKDNLGIKVNYHPSLPLIIFNYDHVLTPHDNPIGLECRGLVLEKETWNVVAKPMYRFFNWAEINLTDSNIPNMNPNLFNFKQFETQAKEDGSLMVLYNYKGKWMLNTRASFLNELPKNKKILMGGIHENNVEDVLQNFVKGIKSINQLEDFNHYLNPECTYCFEFCDSLNKIVREYPPNTIFLLAVINNKTFQEENTEFVNKLAEKIGAKRPCNYNLKSIDEVLQNIKLMSNQDPSLEGFVIKDDKGSRWKIKSQSYFFLHHVTYDKMRTPVPGDLVNLILQGEGSELFSILEINGLKAEADEVRKAWDFCEKRLDEKFKEIKNIWDRIKNIEDKSEFELQLIKSQSILKDFLRELYSENKKSDENFIEKWRQNPALLVENFFTEEERKPKNKRTQELIISDISLYKKPQQYQPYIDFDIFKKDKWWNLINEENDGLAQKKPFYEDGRWKVQCYCGKQMKLFEVPFYIAIYKCFRAPLCIYCKTNNIEDTKGKKKSCLIYQCECGEFHAAHQTEKKIENEMQRKPMKGKPLGIPSSGLTKCLRHKAHEEMAKLIEKYGWSKDQVYREVANILNLGIDKSHVGVLGIQQLKKVINEIQIMINDNQ